MRQHQMLAGTRTARDERRPQRRAERSAERAEHRGERRHARWHDARCREADEEIRTSFQRY